MPQVVVVVLNWNRLADTLACLGSLKRLEYPNYEVVVVDNGSSDGSPAVIRQRFPKVVVIENKENLGYAGGNNVGLRYAMERSANYALLLNNDTVVDHRFLSILVGAAEDDPAVGMAGPLICYFDRPGVIWSAGGEIDWQRGTTQMIGLNEVDAGQYGRMREVHFVTGCALLVKSEVLRQVGLLDERFFAYFEETEWCVRTKRAGFKILFVPQARMWHKISPQCQSVSPTVHYYMTRNRLLFLKAIGAGLPAWLHTLVIEYLRTLVSWSIRPRWRGRRLLRNVMVRAMRDYFLKRWGKAAV